MNKQSVTKALAQARKGSKERKFSQTFDVIFTLKDLNLKKTEEQVEFFTALPHPIGKKKKVCALVGPELLDKAKQVCELALTPDDFDKYKDKKLLKKLAKEYDYFIAQADIMPKVAGAFGKALGPRGKMPNPKAGQILPPKGAVEPAYARMQKMVRVSAKKQLAVQLAVGNDKMKDEDVAENILAVYDQLIHHLPLEKNNIKQSYVKLTMSAPITL